ncbi:latent-transforming growth factor beta-binding protein 1 [Micropterus dolomieu]|uniref:latent-transforming growth factor beta-binding protein 1 n=1 Tax=Micropterus dolomieu TaxID=147949 RepID=UPI001E8CE489|nr:latent-transforming growth factor beta-binding protein 1 [Micropterus dolomieu]
MDMAWIIWGLLSSFGLILSPVCVSAEQQQSQSGFRRLYVLQPGPGPGATGAGGGVRVSSISTRHGAAGQPHTYNVELTSSLGGQVRTRRMGSHAASTPQLSQEQSGQEQSQQRQLMKLSGVNVCGGHCCHGWSKAQGSQRCTKPNCIPQCQNGGMCLRPQLCVCKPGSNGKVCEQKTVPTHPFPALPGNGPTNGHTNGPTNGHNGVPQRPIPQQVLPNGHASAPPPSSNMAQMKLTVKPAQLVRPHYIQQHIQQQIRPMHPGQSQQYVIKPKYYHTHHTQTHVQSHPERPIPLTVGHSPIHVVCHLPCINGGKCSARDKCQCPPSFTGKFCQMPIQNGHQQHQQTSGSYSQTQVHSTHTLPLTYSNGQSPVFSPSIVNIHIKHPPEASVQVHQVSQLDNYHNNGHQLKGSQSGSSSSTSYRYHHTESSQNIQHHGYNIVYPSQHGYQVPQYQPVTSKNTLGRCFQETAGSQCGKALPGLTKQEQCCGTIGTSWGFHKCQKCPKKPLATTAPDQELVVPVISYRPVVEPILPQLSPGVSTVKIEAAYPEVVERSSPPAPVEILPSNAGQDIAPTQSAEVDQCQISPYICGSGICYNTAESYTCHCDEGYRLNDAQTTCVDVDDCLESPSLCFGGRCENTEGSFLCVCPRGFLVDEEGSSCVDFDECADRTVCPSGICFNVPGSYNCGSCPNGFLAQGGQCVDIDECQDQRVCTRGHCQNTEGSFICLCGPGFRVSPAGDHCDDVDECLEDPRPCEAVGECVNNMGSYTCTCPRGYRQVNGTSCRDIDECVDEPELCSPHGECLNTEGSYLCVCESGFTANLDTPTCDDIDECGLNETMCGPHGFCENRLGSFRCLCDQGYQETQDGQSCVDVNECELLSSVCGEAQCVNVDGSFLCVCPSGQDYNVMIAKCEPFPTASSVERKECYYRLNDENLCESVLTSHVTLQECCCTLGAGWGDNCEVHPCPVNGTDQFNQMCPSKRGFIPSGDVLYGVTTAESYKDADECTLFGQEVCKGGFCLDTVGSYECYCKTGQDYDSANLECRDINECLDESVCVGGQCINTDGSYMCFCTHPMMLDPNSNRCIFVPEVAEQHESDREHYQDICWQTVTETLSCTRPLGQERKTTYTECCCLYGEAWGTYCALCPPRHTEDYAAMCNLPLGEGRRPYGHDALVAGPVHEYEVNPDYSPSPEQQAGLPFYENEEYPYKAFEGLQAEECGILNGCENGRCVRVQEGYTCDCFDGYTLDLSRMACVDVNECSELNNRMSLCKNAKCINTVGSYQCECLPGFSASDKPNYCVEATVHQTSTHTQ